jgi:hypothetical protein
VIRYDIYLLTAIGLSPGGSTHLHTNNTENDTHNNRTTQITTNLQECGTCPVFENFTLAFALKLRKKHGKTSVRLRETSVRVQYTYYQKTRTLQKLRARTHTHTHTLQNNNGVWRYVITSIMPQNPTGRTRVPRFNPLRHARPYHIVGPSDFQDARKPCYRTVKDLADIWKKCVLPFVIFLRFLARKRGQLFHCLCVFFRRNHIISKLAASCNDISDKFWEFEGTEKKWKTSRIFSWGLSILWQFFFSLGI